MLIDTHCHLVNEDYDIDKVINAANSANVKYLIVGGSSKKDNDLNINLLSKYDNVFLSVGYHPDTANSISKYDLDVLEKYLENTKIVAIGEIGLDYHYGKENADKQKTLFRKQLDLAKKYNLPVVIHTRDAFLDTYNILKEYDLLGVIHCFSGSLESAKKFIDLGYYLGIGGVITFKNSKLKDVVKEIGIDSVLLETDSPYLSPIRGSKNEPCNVKVICQFISELINIPFDKVAYVTSDNAIKLFGLNIKNSSKY